MLKKGVIIFILLILFGCQKEQHEWNPIFEETNFNYLYDNIEQSLSLIEAASSEGCMDGAECAREKLYQAKDRLLELKDYYVPITAVRQKIYDAERYLKLQHIEKTKKLLNEAKSTVISLEVMTKSKVFDKVVVDLESMIDGAILSLDGISKRAAYDKMKMLGEHVNLMLYKGHLVLSGVEFEK